MKLKKILFSLIVLFSVQSRAELKEYYMEVYNTIKLYCKPGQYFNPKSKTLYKSDLESPIIGICSTDAEDYFKIYVDRNYWDHASEDYRYELMAHEMTHCLFFENHVEDSKHYMYYQIRDLTKEQTKQQLIEFLKKKCNNSI